MARRGAIALDSDGFVESTATRATPQAVLGLSGPGLLTLDGTDTEPAAPQLACAAAPTSSAPASSPTAAPTTAAPTTVAPTSPAAAASTSPAAFGGTLPNTGASPLPVAGIGLGLVAVGTALALLGRRRRPDRP